MSRLRVRAGGQEWVAEVRGDRVTLEGVDGEFVVRTRADGRFEITHADERRSASFARNGADWWIGLDGRPIVCQVEEGSARPRSALRDADALTPPMPATVVRVAVRVGDRVEAGDVLVVLEAMKMELPIRAPRAASVKALHCREGELVQPGDVLVDLG